MDNYELTKWQKREMWGMVKKIKGSDNREWTWWQRRKIEKMKRIRFVYWWVRYKDKDCPARAALMDFITAEEKQIKLGDLLWERGYRHGDHVLVYSPISGAFYEEVVTKFGGISSGEAPFLMAPDMVVGYEETQGNRVKPEDRTQRKFQPNLSSYVTPGLVEL